MKWINGWMSRQWMDEDAKEFWPWNQGSFCEGLRYLAWILKHLNKWRRREDPLHPKYLVPS